MNLKNEDLCCLFSATTMAIYSTEYWENNIENWNNLNGSSTAKAGPRIRRVAGADVIGAAAGAAYAWGANIVPGGGQVAYGSAIVGTAAASSVYQAGMELLNAYDLW